MVAGAWRAAGGGARPCRAPRPRRSLEVTVPSASHQVAVAGSTTSASLAVSVRNMSCTTKCFEELAGPAGVGLGAQRVLADDVAGGELAPLHGLEHERQVPAWPVRH